MFLASLCGIILASPLPRECRVYCEHVVGVRLHREFICTHANDRWRSKSFLWREELWKQPHYDHRPVDNFLSFSIAGPALDPAGRNSRRPLQATCSRTPEFPLCSRRGREWQECLHLRQPKDSDSKDNFFQGRRADGFAGARHAANIGNCQRLESRRHAFVSCSSAFLPRPVNAQSPVSPRSCVNRPSTPPNVTTTVQARAVCEHPSAHSLGIAAKTSLPYPLQRYYCGWGR